MKKNRKIKKRKCPEKLKNIKGSNFDEKASNTFNYDKIKEILNNSFLKNQNIMTFKLNEINFESLENMVNHFKICEKDISVTHRREIYYYIMIGRITKHMKTLFLRTWEIVLKEHEIIYKKEYQNFLIRLFTLFDNYKILYGTHLS